MRIRTCTCVVNVVILLVAAGCSSVTVREPLGTPVAPTVHEKLVGTWISVVEPKEEAIAVEVASDQSGQLWAAMLEFDDKSDAFKVTKIRLKLTHLDGVDLVFFSGDKENEGDDDPNASRFGFWRYQFTEDKSVQFFPVEFDSWRAAIEQQKLKGTIQNAPKLSFRSASIQLDASAEQVAEFMKKEGVEKCFVAEPVITFKRIRWSK